MRYYVTIEGRTVEVDLEPEGIRVDGDPHEVSLAPVPGSRIHSVVVDGESYRVLARSSARGAWELQLDGRPLDARVVDERTRAIQEMTGAAAGAGGPLPVRAPMPGLLVAVEVREGDEVEPGQGLAIVEAMKMENELRAETSGRVQAVLASPGDTVEKDQVLIEFAPAGGDGSP
jgi:pyruvate carboxylase subunit B